MDLSIPVPRKSRTATAQGINLQDCLSSFTSGEIMEKCGYKCSKCKREDNFTKQLTIQKFPKILVIHLKRFENSHGRREKLNTSIDIPTYLDMKPFAPHASKL